MQLLRKALFLGVLIVAAGAGFAFPPGAEAGMRTVPRGQSSGSDAVRRALRAPTEDGRTEALIEVLVGEDLPAALEAMEVLSQLGPRVVPRLVSEMRVTRNNWLIGGALVKMGSEAVRPLIELLDQAEEPTAVDCIYLLGELQDPRAVPTLSRFLNDPRDKVRMYAVSALLQIGGAPAVEAVLSLLSHEGKAIENFIVDALVRYGQKSVEPVILSLASENAKVRREAAYLLGQLGDLRAMDPLVLALEDPEPGVRENAAFGLGELAPHTQWGEGAVEALAARLSDPSERVVEAARRALVRYGERAVPRLLEVCRGSEPDAILAGINALREIGDPAAEEAMIGLLDHPLRSIRVGAAAGLISIGTGRAVEALLDALRDEDLRWFAALALERVGAENPELFFSASPNDPTMSVRTRILVRLGPEVVPFLLEYLDSEELARQAAALWILGEIGDPRAASPVVRFLDDPRLGWLAERAVRGMGAAGLEQLVRYLHSAPSDRAAERAVEALATFERDRAWDALEAAVTEALPRVARVRSAVLLSLHGDPQRVERLRTYLDQEGRMLWPDVEAALRDAGRIQ